MKIQKFNDFLGESQDHNDPLAIAIRNLHTQSKTAQAKQKEYLENRKKFRLSQNKVSELEDRLTALTHDHTQLRSQRRELFREQEFFAGQLGIQEYESSGKADQIGAQIEYVDNKIQKLQIQIRDLETRLQNHYQHSLTGKDFKQFFD